jgi:osmoprotectant transport system substrate-binding protein
MSRLSPMGRLALGLALMTLVGCTARPDPVRIGYKAFTEQRILAHALADRLRAAGLAVAPLTDCGDTWACQRLLRSGQLDVMVDYTGTALNFVGARPGPDAFTRVQALYAPLGQRWLPPLGFDNGYRVLAHPNKPMANISDLARHAGLRVACPMEFTRRPRDGLAALAGRYGLRLASAPLIIEDPGDRLRAVLEGRADVAIGYATDAAISDVGLRALADPLEFFPEYAAAITVRVAAADAQPALIEALAPLSGRIDTATMRALNAQVQITGQRPDVVASQWLVAEGLVDAERAVDTHRPQVVLVTAPSDHMGDAAKRARRAVRAAFPERAVRPLADPNPLAAIRDGRAWLAVVGAERFTRQRLRDRLRGRPGDTLEPGIEAIAVLGERAVHVVRRADDSAAALAGRLGAPDRSASAARLIERALGTRAKAIAQRGNATALTAALRAGTIDAALWLASPGDPGVAALLAGGDLRLHPWPNADQTPVQLPFARVLRVPANTYAGQAEAIDTLSAQVLLAGPAQGTVGADGAGPAGALSGRGAPVTLAQARALAEATGIAEAPDPGLPSAWTARRPTAPTGGDHALDALLNLLVLAFCAWAAWLTFRPEPAG